MFVLGAVFGSFACCQAWRWRWRALGKKDLGQWSVCMHCKKRLKWYDNIPLVSWLTLRGRCRYCHAKIGVADFLSELSLAVAFLMLTWAYLLPVLENWGLLRLNPDYLVTRLAIFVMILVLLIVLTVLAVYDAKWGELPTVLLVLAIVFGGIVALLKVHEAMILGESVWGTVVNLAIGVAILAGTCFVIYKASRERLMGSGDWLLALALALALANWWLALWTIFLANLLGDVIALPGAMKTGKHVVHFGPFLVGAFVIVLVLGNCLPVGAGVVYWGSKRVSYNGYYVSFPRMRREFDSLHPHQRLSEVFFCFGERMGRVMVGWDLTCLSRLCKLKLTSLS